MTPEERKSQFGRRKSVSGTSQSDLNRSKSPGGHRRFSFRETSPYSKKDINIQKVQKQDTSKTYAHEKQRDLLKSPVSGERRKSGIKKAEMEAINQAAKLEQREYISKKEVLMQQLKVATQKKYLYSAKTAASAGDTSIQMLNKNLDLLDQEDYQVETTNISDFSASAKKY